MEFPVYLVIFLFGGSAGSFLNSVIYRLENNLPFPWLRSFCPHCKHTLGFWDLIPVFSFIFLLGKCRYCRQKISWQYPAVETATGLLFLLISNFQFPIYNQFPISQFLNLFYYWLIAGFLIIIFVYDLKHYIIPDKIVYPAIAVSLIYNFQFPIYNQFPIFKFSILSAIGAFVFFLIIVLVSRGKWMGLGDVKLAFLMGLFLGFPNILSALFVSFFLGAIIGIGLIVAGKKTLKAEVPFGPFLVTGTFFAFFWGDVIISVYSKYFNV